MGKDYVAIPIFPEMERIMEPLEKTGKDCVILSLLDWAEHPYDACAARILPPYVYDVYDQCRELLLKHWKRVLS